MHRGAGIAEAPAGREGRPPGQRGEVGDEVFRRHVFALFGERLAAVLQIIHGLFAFEFLDEATDVEADTTDVHGRLTLAVHGRDATG